MKIVIPDEAVLAARAAFRKAWNARETAPRELERDRWQCWRLTLAAAAPAIVRANFADELRRWLTQFVDQYGLDDDAVRQALKELVDDG